MLPQQGTALFDGPNLLSAVGGVHQLNPEHLLPSMHHESTLHNSIDEIPHVLICSTYQDYPLLQKTIPQDSDYHPVLHSLKNDKSCILTTGETSNLMFSDEKYALPFTRSVIPHAIKYHDSIDKAIDSKSSDYITLEVSIGLGVSGKGVDKTKLNEFVESLYGEATDLLQNEKLAVEHWEKFYWTSELSKKTAEMNSKFDAENAQKFRRSSKQGAKCNYKSLMSISLSQSYISFTASTKDHGYESDCIRLLATVAAMHPSVSHVSAHLGVHPTDATKPNEAESLSSIDFADPDAGPATDQNAWVQSGTTDQTPYSEIGVDGTGYVLGNLQGIYQCKNERKICILFQHMQV